VQDLVEDDSDRPDVVLEGVDVALERLRTHVERRAHVHRFLGVGSGLLGEAKVSDLDHFILQQDVCGL
jgi:hypothetical protein